MSKKEYFQIPHTDIDKHWDLFAVLIQKAIDKVDNSDYSIFGTYHRLKTNEWQLFCILEDNELNSIFVTCTCKNSFFKKNNPHYFNQI